MMTVKFNKAFGGYKKGDTWAKCPPMLASSLRARKIATIIDKEQPKTIATLEKEVERLMKENAKLKAEIEEAKSLE